ncbi:hypothetical protein H2280_08420, partial [Campylobacter sp. 2457A]|nr:hypothetical protein [Campylobacter sp. 2457A]
NNITELKEPILRLHYKEHKYQKDNLLIANLFLNDIQHKNEQGFDKFEITKNDLLSLSDDNTLNLLKQNFTKGYDFKECKLRLGVHLIDLIFIIPKNIPKSYKDAYKKFEKKELGAGYFKELHKYNEDYREKDTIMHKRVFFAPACMQNIQFEIAKGLDDWLDNENVCSFNVLTKDYFKAEENTIIINNENSNS